MADPVRSRQPVDPAALVGKNKIIRADGVVVMPAHPGNLAADLEEELDAVGEGNAVAVDESELDVHPARVARARNEATERIRLEAERRRKRATLDHAAAEADNDQPGKAAAKSKRDALKDLDTAPATVAALDALTKASEIDAFEPDELKDGP